MEQGKRRLEDACLQPALRIALIGVHAAYTWLAAQLPGRRGRAPYMRFILRIFFSNRFLAAAFFFLRITLGFS